MMTSKNSALLKWPSLHEHLGSDGAPPVNIKSPTVKGFYGDGYHKVLRYDSSDLSVWQADLNDIVEWSQQNLSGRFRADMHQTHVASDGVDYFNDIGGIQKLYVAFEREEDAVIFRLRWG